ncbi:MAG: flagellar export protein FliJ [Methylomicrobium sp.]|nr:flagellar export protein FliJ [Methylomicrobium sp.]
MKKSERLKTIVELNVTQEKKALETFGQVQKKQVQLQMQIDHLINYRQEYQEKFDAFCKTGARVGQLLEFKSFLDKLDLAINGQEQALQSLETELSRVRGNWIGLHNRTKSLSKLFDAAQADELKQLDRREQIEQDDRVASGRRGGTKNAG